jgi:Thioredoxin.
MKNNGWANDFKTLNFKGKLLVVVGLLVMSGGMFLKYHSDYVKNLHGNTNVSAQVVSNAIASNKTVVFYNQDCSACQRAFPKLMFRNWLHKDILFVNLHSKKNNHFVNDYKIQGTPTYVNNAGSFYNVKPDQLDDLLTHQPVNGN